MASQFPKLFVFFLFHLLSLQVLANLNLEDGYTVVTVIDGHKLKINPRAVQYRPESSDLIVLDASDSAFYSVKFPITQESVIKRFSGAAVEGYSDGESGTAQFRKPQSFDVDLKGNVYVADKNNHAIRKISDSGVTTIAGGYTKKTGAQDGPAQNATFSNDFEVVFIAERCVLLVSDHGNQMVRQINLKAEDCGGGGGSSSATQGVSIWSVVVAVGLSCLIGFVVGLALSPYIRFPHQGKGVQSYRETWKRCLISPEKVAQIPCFAIRSAVVNSYCVWSLLKSLFWLNLSRLFILFSTNYQVPQPQVSSKDSVSLLDSDSYGSGSEITKTDKYANQLKDLMGGFDGSSDICGQMLEQKVEENPQRDFHGTGKRIGNMIESNIMQFADVAKENTLIDGSLIASSGLMKRR